MITAIFLASLLTFIIGSLSSINGYLGLILLIGIVLAPANIVLGGWMPELVLPQFMGKVNALTDPVMMAGHSLALGFISLAFPAWISITWCITYWVSVCLA